jgi:hypothetical protein
LVGNRRIILLKFPAGLEFKINASDIPFLLVPVITYGRTWLDAIVYYAEKFEIICSVVNELCRIMLPLLQYCKKYIMTQMN